MAGWSFSLKVVLLAAILYHVIDFTNREELLNQVKGRESPRISIVDIPEGEVIRCWNEDNKYERYCLFRNLCYSTKFEKFFLYRGNEFVHKQRVYKDGGLRISSTLFQLPIFRRDTHFDYSHLTASGAEIEQHLFREYWPGSFYVTTRMTSGPNIAHDIHDVLMPAFFSLINISGNTDTARYEPTHTLILTFWSDYTLRESKDLYDIMSKYRPVVIPELDELTDSLTCFENVTVGVVTNESLWYDWGVGSARGSAPEAPVTKPKVTPKHFEDFKSYIVSMLGVDTTCSPQGEYAVLFRRKRTRRIVNENYLVEGLSNELGIDVVVMSFEENSLSQMIKVLSCAKLVVGMHGALMIMTMFMPRHSVVLEMFPFALNPDNLQLYRRMLELQDNDIEYVSWRNMDESKSIFPGKEVHNLQFSDLSAADQARILDNSEVAPQLCCDDPEFEFRKLQSTAVDISEVITILKAAINDSM